jgi:hypothetical protein
LCVCVCVRAALGIQHAMRMLHIVICGLPRSTIFFNFISYTPRFSKNVTEHKMCVSNFSTTFARNIFHSKKNWARYDRKFILLFMWSTLYSGPILMKLWFSRHIFEKYTNIKFNENPSGGNGVFPCGQTDERTDGRTDMTKLIVALRNIANAPKTSYIFSTHF